MTRKDYRLIAAQIRDVYDRQDDEHTKLQIRNITYNLCTALKEDNWNFDREKFIAAAIG